MACKILTIHSERFEKDKARQQTHKNSKDPIHQRKQFQVTISCRTVVLGAPLRDKNKPVLLKDCPR